jgi:hypothetical protein
MAQTKKKARFLVCIMVCATLAVCAYLGRGLFYGAMTVHELLSENRDLKEAITNLTQEDQIGYAKIITQEERDGEVFTTVRFVETARDDKQKTILEKEYTIEGDIIHFDSLIVKFGREMVMDGTTRAMYLWRRVYGEKTAPQDGFAIEEPGVEPRRYEQLLKALPLGQRQMFWSSIWELSNDPEKLKEYDIKAIYGNVVYSKLKPGLIYIFRIDPTGQVYPEVVPDM